MVRNINKDIVFLGMKAKPATREDKDIITDLKDTLAANADKCVGMAANMIGFNRSIIICHIGMFDIIMVNPKITAKSKKYETLEGCLSLDGQRKTVRYGDIEVEYEDEGFARRVRRFSGFAAQIIQHEIDHCNGIII